MEFFLTILFLLALIGFSNILNRLIPFVSVPLIQIALGMIAALLPIEGMHLELEPELFFVLFIAPLLFSDGMRIPREKLWALRAPILLLALGLVFATVVVAGLAIHWLIPSVPLSAAFALAAILSPTDAVAVSSLSGRIRLPKNIMHLLEGEALMNDASGLVAFKFAVAATVTGAFSLADATVSFLLIALGGLLTGAVVALLMIRVRMAIRRLGMEDATIHVLIQILTPFVIYLCGEELGVSGILAVVAGGIVHAVERDHTESAIMDLRIVSESTWSVILFVLNGLVFVLLGLQIPDVELVVFRNTAINNFQVIGYIILISLMLIAVRFLWVYLFWRGNWRFGKKPNVGRPKAKSAVLLAFSGVRGTVTLAGAFSIPYVLQDGSLFPERDLLIFIAAGVILFTLLFASMALPLLSRSKKKNASSDRNQLFKNARIRVAEKAIQFLREERDENKAVAMAVISDYRLIQNSAFPEFSRRPGEVYRKMEKEIRLLALQAEKKELQRLHEKEKIPHALLSKHRDFLEIKTIALATVRQQLKLQGMLSFSAAKRFLGKIFAYRKRDGAREDAFRAMRKLRMLTAQAAIAAVRQQINEDNRDISLAVIAEYHRALKILRKSLTCVQENEVFEPRKRELRLKAIQVERNEIQHLFETGQISHKVANKLRQSINDSESRILSEEEGLEA